MTNETSPRARSDSGTELQITPSVLAILSNRSKIRDCLLDEFEYGGVFVPGWWKISLGDSVCVDLMLGSERVCLQHDGVVRWRRQRGYRGSPIGIGVELDKGGAALATYLGHLARGTESHSPQRRARRFHSSLPVECVGQGPLLPGTLHDISSTGVRVSTVEALPPGAQVEVRFMDMVDGVFDVPAVVCWSLPGTGMGLRFSDVLYRTDRHLANFVARLQRDALGLALV